MHPLEKFKYCPVCGSAHFEQNDEKSRKCNNCGFEYYMNPSASAVAFIINSKHELLVTRRAKEPAKGMLDLAGGFCDIGETAEEGVVREVKEETNLDVIQSDYLFSLPNVYLYSGMKIHTLDFFFSCKVKDETTVTAKDDAAECLWLPFEEIRTEQFGLRSIRQGLYKFIEQHQQIILKH